MYNPAKRAMWIPPRACPGDPSIATSAQVRTWMIKQAQLVRARRNLDIQKIFTVLYSSSDYKSANQFACRLGRILAGKQGKTKLASELEITEEAGQQHQDVEGENVVKIFIGLLSSQELSRGIWPQVQKTNNMCVHQCGHYRVPTVWAQET